MSADEQKQAADRVRETSKNESERDDDAPDVEGHLRSSADTADERARQRVRNERV